MEEQILEILENEVPGWAWEVAPVGANFSIVGQDPNEPQNKSNGLVGPDRLSNWTSSTISEETSAEIITAASQIIALF